MIQNASECVSEQIQRINRPPSVKKLVCSPVQYCSSINAERLGEMHLVHIRVQAYLADYAQTSIVLLCAQKGNFFVHSAVGFV